LAVQAASDAITKKETAFKAACTQISNEGRRVFLAEGCSFPLPHGYTKAHRLQRADMVVVPDLNCLVDDKWVPCGARVATKEISLWAPIFGMRVATKEFFSARGPAHSVKYNAAIGLQLGWYITPAYETKHKTMALLLRLAFSKSLYASKWVELTHADYIRWKANATLANKCVKVEASTDILSVVKGLTKINVTLSQVS